MRNRERGKLRRKIKRKDKEMRNKKKRKKNEEKIKEELRERGKGGERLKEIIEGTDDIKERSRILLLDAEFNLKKVIEWGEKMEELERGRERWGEVRYDEREEERERELIKEGEILMGRMRIGERELREMDKEYDRLRGKVNEYYGKEVMREREEKE